MFDKRPATTTAIPKFVIAPMKWRLSENGSVHGHWPKVPIPALGDLRMRAARRATTSSCEGVAGGKESLHSACNLALDAAVNTVAAAHATTLTSCFSVATALLATRRACTPPASWPWALPAPGAPECDHADVVLQSCKGVAGDMESLQAACELALDFAALAADEAPMRPRCRLSSVLRRRCWRHGEPARHLRAGPGRCCTRRCCCPLPSGLWPPGSGLWPLAYGLVTGLWSLATGLWSLGSGLWALVSGLGSLGLGLVDF